MIDPLFRLGNRGGWTDYNIEVTGHNVHFIPTTLWTWTVTHSSMRIDIN